MKNLFLLSIIFISINSYSQGFKLKDEKKQDKQYQLIIDNVSFDLLITNDSLVYQLRTAKESGNVYRFYIGYLTNYLYNDIPVFVDKKTRYYTVVINNNGNLSKKELIN
jgi:hypothetical protein